MELRLAREQDLPELNRMYGNIIREMNRQGIEIWDDFYPRALFPGDIARKELYVLEEGAELLAAFALCRTDGGEPFVRWPQGEKRAMFIDRFGVNIQCRNQGIGTEALRRAGELAASFGAEVLRLFVVDINSPAIALYEKNGFTRAEGIYHLCIDAHTTLLEYGYEKSVR